MNVDFIYEYLLKECEFTILKENNPFIKDFENKMENDELEDVGLIFSNNCYIYDDFQEQYIDQYNLK